MCGVSSSMTAFDTSWGVVKTERSDRFMFMRSPQQALDIIAEMIESQAPLKEQDAWLEAAKQLGLVG